MNLKQLRLEIIKDNDDNINNADMTGWINRGLDELSLIARYTKCITVPVVNSIILPPDFMEMVAVNPNLQRLPLNDFQSEGYKVIGNTIKIQSASKIPTIEIIYIASLPHLVSDTDIPMIPAPFHDLLVLYSLLKTKYIDELDDMYRLTYREYMGRKDQFIAYVNRTRAVPTPIRNVYSGWY